MDTKVIAIASVDRNWAAGYRGHLLIDNPDDLRRFSELTKGSTVVMGRKTFESLPQAAPLPHRKNVIMSKDTSFKPNGCIIVNSINELKSYIDTSNDQIIWIIGGEDIWMGTLDLIDECQITSHYCECENADTYFPNLDILDEWNIASIEGPYTTDSGIDYEYRTYRKLL